MLAWFKGLNPLTESLLAFDKAIELRNGMLED